MTGTNGKGVIATVGTTLGAAFLALIGHFGAFGDDVARALGGSVDDAARAGVHVAPAVLDDLPKAVKPGVDYIKGLRNGTIKEDKEIARAACAVMNTGFAFSPRKDQVEQEIRDRLGPLSVLGRGKISTIANYMVAAEQNGALANFYLHACLG